MHFFKFLELGAEKLTMHIPFLNLMLDLLIRDFLIHDVYNHTHAYTFF